MNDNKNTEDILNEFIENSENNKSENEVIVDDKNIQYFGPNVKQKVDYIEADSQQNNIPLNILPFSKFYQDGTLIYIRPAKTKEIESFSIVNDQNQFDVINKLNEILSACVKIECNGKPLSYRDIMDGDRDTLAILVARLSIKNGKKIEKPAICNCTTPAQEIKIDMIPANYIYFKENDDIKDFFNNNLKVYEFPLENGNSVKLAPPTIGLTQDVNNYIFYKTASSEGKVTPNVTFMKCLPYMKSGLGIKNLSLEQLEQEEFNFTMINDELFMFIDDCVNNYLIFGIEKLKSFCPKCREEVYTQFGFPEGARNLFIVRNAFKQFIRQSI